MPARRGAPARGAQRDLQLPRTGRGEQRRSAPPHAHLGQQRSRSGQHRRLDGDRRRQAPARTQVGAADEDRGRHPPPRGGLDHASDLIARALATAPSGAGGRSSTVTLRRQPRSRASAPGPSRAAPPPPPAWRRRPRSPRGRRPPQPRRRSSASTRRAVTAGPAPPRAPAQAATPTARSKPGPRAGYERTIRPQSRCRRHRRERYARNHRRDPHPHRDSIGRANRGALAKRPRQRVPGGCLRIRPDHAGAGPRSGGVAGRPERPGGQHGLRRDRQADDESRKQRDQLDGCLPAAIARSRSSASRAEARRTVVTGSALSAANR